MNEHDAISWTDFLRPIKILRTKLDQPLINIMYAGCERPLFVHPPLVIEL